MLQIIDKNGLVYVTEKIAVITAQSQNCRSLLQQDSLHHCVQLKPNH